MARRLQTRLAAAVVLLALCPAVGAAPRVPAKRTAKTATPPAVTAVGRNDSIELPADDWINLLPIVIPERDDLYTRKDWQRAGNALLTAPGQDSTAVLTIPVVPRGSYQLEVTFMPATGNGYTYIILPAGEGSGTLALCDKDSRSAYEGNQQGAETIQGISGLEAIEGKNACANGTGRKFALLPKTVHTVQATVNRDDDRGRVTITATLNGKQFVRWTGKQELLFAVYQRHKKHLGIAARHGAVSFRSARLKMLSGKAYAELPDKRKQPPKVGSGRIKIRRTAPQ
jgi:hypothetical protein